MNQVVITSATRTAIGSFQGALSDFTAPQLGALVIKEAITRSGLKTSAINEVIMGEVLTAGVGQAPARQAAIGAGLDVGTPCMTINKVCGSGLKAVMLASDNIRLGATETAIAGGQENMTLAPHLLQKSRTGFRMGNTQLIDSMVHDGLWDPYNNWHMGNAAELCVKEYSFTREQQDEFAIGSYKKAQEASQKGLFAKEITGIEIKSKKGPTRFDTDEEPFKTDFAKVPGLRPAFDKAGSITAANASKINDGAAALTLCSTEYLKTNKDAAKPLARIVSYATHAQDPKWFTTAPVGAMKKAALAGQVDMAKIDLFEINEAFAVVTMAAMKDLNLSSDRVNVRGGAVALGHPIGASGARLLTTLVHTLHETQTRYGMVSLCIGGGEAVALLVERI